MMRNDHFSVPEGSPTARFVTPLRRHMRRGTRPKNARWTGAWSPDRLASEIGVTRRTIENYCSGNTLPPDASKIADAFFNDDAHHAIARIAFLIAFAEATDTEAPVWSSAFSNIPTRVPTHFMGRDDALIMIRTALGRNAGRVAITALHGLRGVGKTTLAAAYAERHRSNYRVTWWIRAQTVQTMRTDLVSLGTRLNWSEPEDTEDEALVIIKEKLRHDGDGILLIYDNAVGPRDLGDYLPNGGEAEVIVTSNSHAWRGIAEPVQIGVWSKEIGAEYLIGRTGRYKERSVAETLSDLLGGLPLALEQAAAYCEYLDISLGDYVGRLGKSPGRLLDDDRYAPGEYYDGRTVAKTFLLAIEQAARLHLAAEPVLQYAASLAPEPIPLFLLREASQIFGEPSTFVLPDDGLDEALAALQAFALVGREEIPDERDPRVLTSSIRLHRLVREVVRLRRSESEAGESRAILIQAIKPVFITDGRPTNWVRARRLEPLIAELLEPVGRSNSDKGEWIDLLFAFTIFRLESRASYIEAKDAFTTILDYQISNLGMSHEVTLQTMHVLAFSTRGTGDMLSAMELYRQVIELRSSVLGLNHRDTLETMNHLGFCLHRVGEFEASEKLIRDVIDRQRRNLGESHPDTLVTTGNLAICLAEKGDLEEAEKLYRYVLAEQERIIGLDGLTLESIGNLAFCLMRRNNIYEAEQLFERMLQGAEFFFGPDHPTYRTARDALDKINGKGS